MTTAVKTHLIWSPLLASDDAPNSLPQTRTGFSLKLVESLCRKVADPSPAPSFGKGRGTQQAPAVPGWLYVVAVAVAAAAEAALSAGALRVEPQGRSQT